jgi:carbamoyl-phosphate synthase large subunit
VPHFFVKEAVFPFNKFPGVDPMLGPGDEVHRRGHGYVGATFAEAFGKAQLAAGIRCPRSGKAC